MAKVTQITFIRFICVPTALICVAVENLPVQPLHIKIVCNELFGQVIKQGFITRWISKTHIIRRINNAYVKVVGPNPIYKSTSEVSVIW